MFCFLDIRSENDTMVASFYSLLALAILFYAIITYLRNKDNSPQYKPQPIIYYALFIWSTMYISVFVFGIILQATNNIYQSNKSIPMYSKIYSCIDALPAFTIQGLFIFIPFNMYEYIKISMKNTYHYCTQKCQFLTRSELIIYKLIRMYQKFRFIRLIGSIIIFIPDDDQAGILRVLCEIGIWYTAGDALLCNCILIWIRRSIMSKKSVLKLMKPSQLSQLKKQLILLNISCTTRWLLDGIAIIYPMIFKINTCPGSTIFNTYIYLLIGQIFLHILPAAVILKMHIVKKSDETQNSLNYETTQTMTYNSE